MNFDEHMRAASAALDRAAYDDAREHLQQAGAAASTDADHAIVQMRLAAIGILQGRRDVDLNVFRENVVRRYSDRHVSVATYYLLITAIDGNDLPTAERYLPTYLEATRALNDPVSTLASYDVIASMESLRGNHVAALEYNRVAIEESENYAGEDALALRAYVTHNAVYDCLAANAYAEALAYAGPALELAEELGNPMLLRQCLITVSFAYLGSERLDDAERLAERAADLAAGTRLERYVHYLRGEVARRRGDTAIAAAHFKRLQAFYPDIPGVSEMLLSMNVAPFLMPE
jgi:tetratricopeptide (TPR) repeat protein